MHAAQARAKGRPLGLAVFGLSKRFFDAPHDPFYYRFSYAVVDEAASLLALEQTTAPHQG